MLIESQTDTIIVKPNGPGIVNRVDPSQIEFQPSIAVRVILSVVSLPGLLAILLGLPKLLNSGPKSLLLAAVMVCPVIGAFMALRYRIRVTNAHLELRTALRTKVYQWNQVRRIDQTRSSWVISVGQRHIGLGWIDSRTRERLFRLILQNSGLIYQMSEMRWGIRARYMPKSVPIKLNLPLKSKTASGDSQNRKAS